MTFCNECISLDQTMLIFVISLSRSLNFNFNMISVTPLLGSLKDVNLLLCIPTKLSFVEVIWLSSFPLPTSFGQQCHSPMDIDQCHHLPLAILQSLFLYWCPLAIGAAFLWPYLVLQLLVQLLSSPHLSSIVVACTSSSCLLLFMPCLVRSHFAIVTG